MRPTLWRQNSGRSEKSVDFRINQLYDTGEQPDQQKEGRMTIVIYTLRWGGSPVQLGMGNT